MDGTRFQAPIFSGYARLQAWLTAPRWPGIDALNEAFGAPRHPHSGATLRFAAQTPQLLADGLHYEQRIHATGVIATREDNWHDLLNAMVWITHPGLKAALNARQVQDIRTVGASTRTRAQCALTHFDEAGVVAVLRDPALLSRWDTHDWSALFHSDAEAWSDGRIEVIVFGHALLEHALQPRPVHTAKCLVVFDVPGPPGASDGARECVARSREAATARCIRAIATGEVLRDPQELRPLPLSGIPGWHPDTGDAQFYHTAPCFRPLPPGRRYAPAIGAA